MLFLHSIVSARFISLHSILLHSVQNFRSNIFNLWKGIADGIALYISFNLTFSSPHEQEVRREHFTLFKEVNIFRFKMVCEGRLVHSFCTLEFEVHIAFHTALASNHTTNTSCMRWEEDMTTSIWFMRSLVGCGEGQWSWLMGFSAILSAELIIEYQKVIKS